jgi:hypothetical protein
MSLYGYKAELGAWTPWEAPFVQQPFLRTATMSDSASTVGTDISKATFDAARLDAAGKYKHKKFANTLEGFAAYSGPRFLDSDLTDVTQPAVEARRSWLAGL